MSDFCIVCEKLDQAVEVLQEQGQQNVFYIPLAMFILAHQLL